MYVLLFVLIKANIERIYEYYVLLWSCSDSGIDDEDEFATKFIYNKCNNASTDNITAGVAA